MVILRCTRELLARITRSAVEPTASSTTRLGDWYVALVRIGQRQLLLAVSERTRLPAIVPARDARGMAEPLAGAVGRVLHGIGVPEAEAEVESSAMAEAVFAPTRNRSLLGTLNDFTVAIQHHLHSEPDMSLDELAIELADTPIHTPFHDGAPVDVTRRVFGLAAAPRNRLTFDPLASPAAAVPTMPKPRRPPARRRSEPLPMGFALYAEMASVQRCEYLDGAMHVSSSPSPAHQVAVLRIGRALEDHFAKADREAVVLAGPVAVFLGDQAVAQPDVVVASRKQLSARGVEGPPRLVVEVVTAASAECDRDVKVRSYAAAGVESYWLIDVDRRTVESLGRRRPTGAATVSLSRGVLAPTDVPGFELRLETLWL